MLLAWLPVDEDVSSLSSRLHLVSFPVSVERRSSPASSHITLVCLYHFSFFLCSRLVSIFQHVFSLLWPFRFNKSIIFLFGLDFSMFDIVFSPFRHRPNRRLRSTPKNLHTQHVWSGRLIKVSQPRLSCVNKRLCVHQARAAWHCSSTFLVSLSILCIYTINPILPSALSDDLLTLGFSPYFISDAHRLVKKKNIKGERCCHMKRGPPLETKMRVWHRQWNIDDRWSRAFQNVAVLIFSLFSADVRNENRTSLRLGNGFGLFSSPKWVPSFYQPSLK